MNLLGQQLLEVCPITTDIIISIEGTFVTDIMSAGWCFSNLPAMADLGFLEGEFMFKQITAIAHVVTMCQARAVEAL